jgi:hypothetical protein
VNTIIVVLLAACGREASPRVEFATFDEAIEWTGRITLEENAEVINVAPTVRVDGEEFLVADAREAQFRIYGADGGMIGHFGARGDGPGEFRAPVVLDRLPDRSLLAVDRLRGLTVHTPDGQALVRTIETPFTGIHDLRVIDDTLVYVVAPLPGRDMEERIHITNMRSGEIVRSFFRPPLADDEITAVVTVGVTGMAIRGDTIAATYALRDSVFLFTKDGEYLETLPIPFRNFRPVGPPPLPGSGGSSTRDWIDSFTIVGEVFWQENGDFLIQYDDRENMMPRWRLLGMSREGRRIFDLSDTPRLYAASSDGSRLYFADPDALTANVLRTARLRATRD